MQKWTTICQNFSSNFHILKRKEKTLRFQNLFFCCKEVRISFSIALFQAISHVQSLYYFRNGTSHTNFHHIFSLAKYSNFEGKFIKEVWGFSKAGSNGQATRYCTMLNDKL